MHSESPRVEFLANHTILEIRYFDSSKGHRYLSWRLPESIVNELIAFGISLKDKEIHYPIRKKTKVCEFIMYTEKFIEIKSLDALGRTNMIGWSLPSMVVEELISRRLSKDSK